MEVQVLRIVVAFLLPAVVVLLVRNGRQYKQLAKCKAVGSAVADLAKEALNDYVEAAFELGRLKAELAALQAKRPPSHADLHFDCLIHRPADGQEAKPE